MSNMNRIRIAIISLFLLATVFTQSDNSTSITDEVTDQEAVSQFQQFLKDFNKTYSSLGELSMRYISFKTNFIRVRAKQIKNLGVPNKHSVGVTKFMDLTPQQFQSQYANLVVTSQQLKDSEDATVADVADVAEDNSATEVPSDASQTNTSGLPNLQAPLPILTATIPASWDWRSYGVVSPVKNQGSCGYCWAFSAIANIEGLYARKYGTLKSFSEEQLLDCDYSNSGCNGGNMQYAFNYVKNAGGVMSSSNYPLSGTRNGCKFSKSLAIARVTGNFNAGQNEATIKNYVYTTGPLSVALNAKTLQYYTGGILTSSAASCNPNTLTHGVTIVGYGTANGINYWIVKNSWGPSWGDKGFFKIARGYGTCGINKYVTSAYIA